MGRNIGKNISKNLSSKYSQKIIDHAKQSTTDLLKTALKIKIRKQQKKLVIWLEIKLLIELQVSQKRRYRIIQKQMKKKYLEKYLYLQNKDRTLLMI